MTVEEIFKNLANHMIKGLMLHEELANYYDFLNLTGYKKCHQYRYFDESCNYRKLYHYYINHYNKLIEKQVIKTTQIIPSSWYKHVKQDVDFSLKMQSIETAYEKWIKWEKETKDLYQNYYTQLLSIKQGAAALFLQEYLKDVDNELQEAESQLLDLKAINFDMSLVIDRQDKTCKKYKRMIEEYKIY